MRWTVARLRLGIVVLAVVLLLSIAGSIVYGRWRLRHLAQDLPGRLGIQIQQTTQGFVLSKTEQGRTIFTLHAARAIAFKTGGLVSLHDVEIDMYNREDNQADTIAGNDFEYDRTNQIVRAEGEAHIALHVPPSGSALEAGKKQSTQMVHVTTHGLVFNQKTGMATCSGEVDFQFSGSSGRAMGAVYDSQQGRLLLQSQVALTTVMRGRPTAMHATQATYDRNESLVSLMQPHYFASTPQGNEQGSADKATVLLRPDGSVEEVDAQGGVNIAAADGNSIRSASMQARLTESSQMEKAHFLGGVQFAQKQPTQQTSGEGREAVVDFDANGHPSRVTIDGSVRFQQQVDAEKNHLYRTLAAKHLVLYLQQGAGGHARLKTAEATGNAAFTSRNTIPGHAPQDTGLTAQVLKARFQAGNAIQHLDGTGQTKMRMVAANGDIDTSTGDTLSVDFATGEATRFETRSTRRPAPDRTSDASTEIADISRKRRPHDVLSAQSIRTAVQTGHVVLQQQSATGTGGSRVASGATSGPQTSTATAARAEFDGASDTVTLTGEPEFHNATLAMAADRFEVEYSSGKVLAFGAVKTTLRPGSNASGPGGRTEGLSGSLLSGNLPVHVIARQALLQHDAQKAVFTGQARLWQGGNTVEAPVIEVSRKMQTLEAYGNGNCTECVHSTFLEQSVESTQPGRKTVSGNGQPGVGGPSTLRVLSGRLLYSDAERKASFFDHVEAIGSAGDLFADRVDVFLTPAMPHLPEASGSIPTGSSRENDATRRNYGSQSSVERIVASGHVRLIQPGRRGMGLRLVYTAKDGKFVLTGDRQSPPEVVDANHGTVTGQELTFASPTQAIIVSGTSNDSTTTRTRVSKK